MANVKFEFSNMAHPTADDETGSEVWTRAPAFYEAEIHWLLGHTPDSIECYFHVADQRQFPWTRVRGIDENGIVGIWRFDTVEEQFEGGQRVWKATGRCVLYGGVDNYMRSPRIKADQAVAEGDPDLDDDPYYTEWPILSAKSLVTQEDLIARYEDQYYYRRAYCKELIDTTGCGGPNSPCDTVGEEESDCGAGKHTHSGFPYCHDESAPHKTANQAAEYIENISACVYATNEARDERLLHNFLENRYNVEESKLGPNYAWKGVRRGWVFKDILRHSSGTHSAASRPILGVYNRSAPTDPIEEEGTPIRSNFQQGQAAGVGANALAYDVAISWPWIVPEQTEIEKQMSGGVEYEGDSGYDYRTVWPGKTDRYAESGQAVEIFQRGSQPWDDSVGFSCGEPSPCPEKGPEPVKVYLVYFQTQAVQKFVELDYYPMRSEICQLKPGPAHINIIGMGVLVTVVDHSKGTYDVSEPSSIYEWLGRFPGFLPIDGPNMGIGGSNGSIICYETDYLSAGGRCWCESHCYSVSTPYGSFTWCSGLIGLWLAPKEMSEYPCPPEFECKELAPNHNIAVFLHKTDVSKDYLCYNRLP